MGQSFPLTFIFFKMGKTTNQILICVFDWHFWYVFSRDPVAGGVPDDPVASQS
jgi:hypothetical protein